MAEDNPNKARFQSDVKIGSEAILQSEIFDLVIIAQIDQPDMCSITLTQKGAIAHQDNIKSTDDYTVTLAHEGDSQDHAFVGELTHIEPVYSPGGDAGGRLVVRGLNAMHALSRSKQSCVYQDPNGKLTDADIIKQILQRNSSLKLSVDYGSAPPDIEYECVIHPNKTDLEFLRHRASRLNCFMLVRNDKLLFQSYSVPPSGLQLVLNASRSVGDSSMMVALERFVPRVSNAAQVTQVRLRSWHSGKRTHIMGIAPSDSAGGTTSMAANDGKSAIQDKHPDSAHVRHDVTFSSVAEGNRIAASLLREHKLSYVTAEGSLPGDTRLKPGTLVDISTGNPIHDGKYFITYVRHSYRTAGDDARFMTDFKASRDSVEDAGAAQDDSE